MDGQGRSSKAAARLRSALERAGPSFFLLSVRMTGKMIDEEGYEHPDLDGDVTIGRIDCMDRDRRDVPFAEDRNGLPCPDRRSQDECWLQCDAHSGNCCSQQTSSVIAL